MEALCHPGVSNGEWVVDRSSATAEASCSGVVRWELVPIVDKAEPIEDRSMDMVPDIDVVVVEAATV